MKVRRKIINMKAVQWLGTPESLEEIKKVGTIDEFSYFERSNSLYFCSLNRPNEITKVGVNDWIIEEVAGVWHLCRSDVFGKTYAVVEEKEVLDRNLSYLRDTVNSSLIRTAIKRFSEVVNGLECECDSCNAYTCIIQNDKVLAERALKVLEPAPKTTICEYTDLDGEGTCDYTNERCRFKNVENCKNFIEDEIVGTTNFKGFKIVLTPIPRNSEDPIICEGCGASDYDPRCLNFPTLNEAVKYAKELLEDYRSSAIVREEWHTDMDNFRIVDAAGTVYYRFKRINEISRPDDIDEDGYSRSVGEYWQSYWEYTCDYELREVNEK